MKYHLTLLQTSFYLNAVRFLQFERQLVAASKYTLGRIRPETFNLVLQTLQSEFIPR